MRVETKEYLGDSVYVAFDGYGIVLTTENGLGASNTIVLEPDVIRALEKYISRLKDNRGRQVKEEEAK